MFVVRSGGPAASQPPEGGHQPEPDGHKQEQFILKLEKKRKLFGFLRHHRHQIFDDGFQAELEAMYRDTGAGKEPVPTALLATALVLQGTSGCPSPTRSRRRSPTCGGNWCSIASAPPSRRSRRGRAGVPRAAHRARHGWCGRGTPTRSGACSSEPVRAFGPRVCTPFGPHPMHMAVHSFLRQRKDEILRSWEARVTSEHHEVELVGLVLRDDVPALLDALADWLESDQPPERSPATAEASRHVIQRLDQGLALAQVFLEYRRLRESIIQAVLEAEAEEQERAGASGEQGRLTRIKELARLNAGLDVMLSQSIVEFVAERERRAAEERTRAEGSLRELNRQLRDSDRRKTEFLAMLSHELRNPLAPIRNSIYLLERAAPGTEPAVRAREVVRRQTEHLTRLVEDLLDLTRISRGKIPLERSRVDLREIVRKTTDDLHSLFAQAGIMLRVDHVTAGPIWVEADSTRMAQVLANLLNNALKFTPSGGAVRVSVASRDGRAEVSVIDSGIGLRPQDVETVFEAFVQADHSLARTKGGLGLGLALVKSIVELHGGTVAARSDGPGRGAEFLVRIPLADAAAESEKPRHLVTPGMTPRTVLLIEDNVDGAQTLADVLAMHGHRVRVARDGRSGIALAHELQPDVILCDIGLPDMDGFDVARTLRCDGQLRHARLVALSGYAQPEDRQRAHDAGFDAHIPKPPDLDDLLAARQLAAARD